MLTRWIERIAWVVGFTLLGMYGGVRLWAEESRAQAVEEFRAMTVAPADQSLWSQQRVVAYAEAQRAGDAPEAVLRIPSLPLEVPVYADTSELNLDRGAGRIPGTAGLEQSGNLGLAAHRDGFFRKLKDADLGMEILLEPRRTHAALPHRGDQHRHFRRRFGARPDVATEHHARDLLPILFCRLGAQALHRARRTGRNADPQRSPDQSKPATERNMNTRAKILAAAFA